jgi:hypothetical protein
VCAILRGFEEKGNMNKKSILAGLLLLLLSNVYGVDFAISGAELKLDIKAEYNRSFYFCWDIAAVGSVEINDWAAISGGLALGMTGVIFDIDTFVSGEFDMPFWEPLFLGIAYSYNGLPEYETHIHTLRPTVSVKGKWAGITVGPALRFTGVDSAVIFEPILAFSGFVNFYNTEKFRIGMRVANFTDYMPGNFGSYSLNLNSVVRFEKFSLINELELSQSGSSVLAATFYGIAYKGGVLFRW